MANRQANQGQGNELQLESLQWGRETYSVPPKTTGTPTTNEKYCFFDLNIAGITRGGGNFQNKIGALVSWFDIGPTVQGAAEEILQPIYNHTTRGINVLAPGGTFTFLIPW